jgi:hypothetical protein
MKRLFVIYAVVACALLLASLAPATVAAAPGSFEAAACTGEGVYLYDGKNYTGRCAKFTRDDTDLTDEAFSNIASSIRIVGDWTATLFVDQNYGGSSSTFTRDDPDLTDDSVRENRASSIRVAQGDVPRENQCDGRDGVYLYEDKNFAGRCLKLTDDISDLSELAFSNITSSIEIHGDWTATLYVDQNYSGSSSTFTSNDSDLSNNSVGENRASAVRVQKGNVPSGNACDGGEGVYLYEHPNYQGRCVKFTGDWGDLRTVSFDDTASSLRILGSWTAVLFRDLNGTGISSTYSQDDPNLADDGIGDNQATSIGVRRGTTPSGNACDGGEGVYLYEHPNYQGRCVKLAGDAGDLRTLNFDDIVSSVRIVGPWTATLYRDLYGTGIPTTYTQSSPNVAGDPIGDNQATSAIVRR